MKILRAIGYGLLGAAILAWQVICFLGVLLVCLTWGTLVVCHEAGRRHTTGGRRA